MLRKKIILIGHNGEYTDLNNLKWINRTLYTITGMFFMRPKGKLTFMKENGFIKGDVLNFDTRTKIPKK